MICEAVDDCISKSIISSKSPPPLSTGVEKGPVQVSEAADHECLFSCLKHRYAVERVKDIIYPVKKTRTRTAHLLSKRPLRVLRGRVLSGTWVGRGAQSSGMGWHKSDRLVLWCASVLLSWSFCRKGFSGSMADDRGPPPLCKSCTHHHHEVCGTGPKLGSVVPVVTVGTWCCLGCLTHRARSVPFAAIRARARPSP